MSPYRRPEHLISDLFDLLPEFKKLPISQSIPIGQQSGNRASLWLSLFQRCSVSEQLHLNSHVYLRRKHPDQPIPSCFRGFAARIFDLGLFDTGVVLCCMPNDIAVILVPYQG